MDARREVRAAELRSLGADGACLEECLRYTENVFERKEAAFPLPDEAFVATWESYAAQCRRSGSIEFLKEYLVQLRFPIAPGMSELPAYGDATRKGRSPDEIPEATGLTFNAPERCRICIHPTPAGRIPLLIAADRDDFVALVRALTKRNEPAAIPESMGACMVAGYNNWHRVRTLRATGDPDWMSRKEDYQDRFILLSEGPYSGVSAEAMGLPDPEWRRLSLIIRREHECAHYFTRRVFSSMRNHPLDELIADYCGIYAATGSFRADWFLRFIGLENFPEYREGGRLQNYRGDPPLSDGAFAILQRVIARAAENLERVNRPPDARFLTAVSRFTLEELASADVRRQLVEADD
jgi:hypothetical protein